MSSGALLHTFVADVDSETVVWHPNDESEKADPPGDNPKVELECAIERDHQRPDMYQPIGEAKDDSLRVGTAFRQNARDDGAHSTEDAVDGEWQPRGLGVRVNYLIKLIHN